MYTNETPKSQVSRQIQTDNEKKEFKKKKEKKIRRRGRITANTRSASAFTKYNIRELHGNQ